MRNGGENGQLVTTGPPRRDAFGRFVGFPGPGRGHRRLPRTVKEAALLHAPEALERLISIMRGDDTAEARTAAAIVLAYAIGTPYRQPPPAATDHVPSILAAINARRAAIAG
jgi:hypothetical protein